VIALERAAWGHWVRCALAAAIWNKGFIAPVMPPPVLTSK
jgi:hypothetical protein